jgi:hypothetical protein
MFVAQHIQYESLPQGGNMIREDISMVFINFEY